MGPFAARSHLGSGLVSGTPWHATSCTQQVPAGMAEPFLTLGESLCGGEGMRNPPYFL